MQVVLGPHELAAFSAARHGREEELKNLLESVHVNVINEPGNTLLIVGAQVGLQRVATFASLAHSDTTDYLPANRGANSRLLVIHTSLSYMCGDEKIARGKLMLDLGFTFHRITRRKFARCFTRGGGISIPRTGKGKRRSISRLRLATPSSESG